MSAFVSQVIAFYKATFHRKVSSKKNHVLGEINSICDAYRKFAQNERVPGLRRDLYRQQLIDVGQTDWGGWSNELGR